jgi:predicted small metal-binding protein
MRVIDCDCGHTLQAANDEDLFKVTREHLDQEHDGAELSDEQVRGLIEEQAYTATDS